jgi:hypothetical protein
MGKDNEFYEMMKRDWYGIELGSGRFGYSPFRLHSEGSRII